MRISLLYFTLFSTLFFFASCEKVIELDLKGEKPKFVIEATVNKDSLVHTVKITKTIEFDQTGNYPTVDNAIVVLSDNFGNSENLVLIRPGIYQTKDFIGVEGRTYTLNVTIEDEFFSSTSTMPKQVVVDSLTVQEFSFGPTPVYSLVANRLDPAGIKNYYSFNLYQNDKLINGIFLQDDQYSDGVEILQPIFGGDFALGDTATLEMMCIDANVYKYFFTLSANGGGTGGAVPANPESNFGGDCLGYFSAQTKQRLKRKIE
jgi:hypothetical protein